MSFACREELAIKGVNPNTDAIPPHVPMHSCHKSICIGNGVTAASTHLLFSVIFSAAGLCLVRFCSSAVGLTGTASLLCHICCDLGLHS
jgi:hypothetical protein